MYLLSNNEEANVSTRTGANLMLFGGGFDLLLLGYKWSTTTVRTIFPKFFFLLHMDDEIPKIMASREEIYAG